MYIKFDADTSSNGKGFIAMVNLGGKSKTLPRHMIYTLNCHY